MRKSNISKRHQCLELSKDSVSNNCRRGKGRIVGMHEADFPFREMRLRLKRNHSAVLVLRAWSLWSEEDIQHRQPGSERPRRTNER
jgi:hypothetical protein